MLMYKSKKYSIEYIPNLKHWGKNIEYCYKDEVTPYFRFYAIFIFFEYLKY